MADLTPEEKAAFEYFATLKDEIMTALQLFDVHCDDLLKRASKRRFGFNQADWGPINPAGHVPNCVTTGHSGPHIRIQSQYCTLRLYNGKTPFLEIASCRHNVEVPAEFLRICLIKHEFTAITGIRIETVAA